MNTDLGSFFNLLKGESLNVWFDFLSLFNSQPALLYFGMGGVIMGWSSQYNCRLSSALNKLSIISYRSAKYSAIFVIIAVSILIVIKTYLLGHNTKFDMLFASYSNSATAYALVLATTFIVLSGIVAWINQPYPDLKNNVAGIGNVMAAVYFIFEVQGITLYQPEKIIVVLLLALLVIYLTGNRFRNRKSYLLAELNRHEKVIEKINQKIKALEKN